MHYRQLTGMGWHIFRLMSEDYLRHMGSQNLQRDCVVKANVPRLVPLPELLFNVRRAPEAAGEDDIRLQGNNQR